MGFGQSRLGVIKNAVPERTNYYLSAFQMGTFSEQPGLTAFHISLPLEKSSAAFRFPVSPQSSKV